MSVRIDALNPGHFFASCGLLEVAHRLWPGSMGHFSGDAFHLQASHEDPAAAIAERLAQSGVDLASDASAYNAHMQPITLTGLSELRLDWWTRERAMKTWAGQQKTKGTWE